MNTGVRPTLLLSSYNDLVSVKLFIKILKYYHSEMTLFINTGISVKRLIVPLIT